MTRGVEMNEGMHQADAAVGTLSPCLGHCAAHVLTVEDETALIRRSQTGDVDAFNTLVERYQRQLYGVAYRMLGNADAAADAVQEGFLAAYRNLKRHRGGTLAAWLTRITINKCYDLLRGRRRRMLLSLDAADGPAQALMTRLADPCEPTDERVMRRELATALEQAVQELPADQRLAVVLSDIHGYSYEEIVAATGWPIGTLKSRLSRGRARLRDAMRQKKGRTQAPLYVAAIDEWSDDSDCRRW